MDYLLFLGGLGALVAGADRLIWSTLSLAHRVGISAFLAGVVVIGFGTSLPELVTSVSANLKGLPGAAIGNVIGSNIANLLLVLGVSALWLPANVDRGSTKRDGAWLIGAAIAAVALMQFEVIGRLAGLALVVGLAVYLCASLRSSSGSGIDAEPLRRENSRALGRDLVNTAVGIVALSFGAHFMVTGAMGIADDLGISETLVGIVLLALGASLPEVAVTVVALTRGKGDLALGNVLGSTLFNLFGVLGIVALVRPLIVPHSVADVHVWSWPVPVHWRYGLCAVVGGCRGPKAPFCSAVIPRMSPSRCRARTSRPDSGAMVSQAAFSRSASRTGRGRVLRNTYHSIGQSTLERPDPYRQRATNLQAHDRVVSQSPCSFRGVPRTANSCWSSGWV